MAKRYYLLLSFTTIFLLYGCAAGPKPIPTTYFQKDYEMSVGVTKCPEKPQMMDSGRGGIVGLIVLAGRASEMREKMEGIKGSALKELLRQRISSKLEKHFEIVDTQTSLSTEVQIYIWGFFLPTTAFGIKTGSYQFRIQGSVDVYDNKGDKKIQIANTSPIITEQPMGNDPTKDVAQEAMLQAIEDFTNKVVSTILANAI